MLLHSLPITFYSKGSIDATERGLVNQIDPLTFHGPAFRLGLIHENQPNPDDNEAKDFQHGAMSSTPFFLGFLATHYFSVTDFAIIIARHDANVFPPPRGPPLA